MKGFNLSEWAINHRPFVWYLMLLFVVAGVLSYIELGREEDPSFSIKTMLVETYWPGANIDDTMLQITDRIERNCRRRPGSTISRARPSLVSRRSTSMFSIIRQNARYPTSGTRSARKSPT